tara:strand:+ start:12748 stop:13713 length:966 start_codon:yes stop_codon:yes gene_type:complete
VADNCRICGSTFDDITYDVKEMYFGTRDVFEYRRCSACTCLQIGSIPADIGNYYPEHYYSLHIKKQHRHGRMQSTLREMKLNAALGGDKLMSAMLFFLRKPRLPPWVDFLQLTSTHRILDVGCGAGKLLLKLDKKGFRCLEGVDPFIDAPIAYPCGVKIYKEQLWDIARDSDKFKCFDLVMMHHSLEHIPDQHRTFTAAADLLKAQGRLLVRVPLSSSWAWQHYREHWVQLDAPRHLYLHSASSLEQLAHQHGFTLDSVHFDSTAFQFTGSEKYLRDIALVDKTDSDCFSTQQLSQFKQQAETLNREGNGDQACFVFKLVA